MRVICRQSQDPIIPKEHAAVTRRFGTGYAARQTGSLPPVAARCVNELTALGIPMVQQISRKWLYSMAHCGHTISSEIAEAWESNA